MNCEGVRSCEGAVINLNNPRQALLVQCLGAGSCRGTTINIFIPTGGATMIQGLKCVDTGACEDLTVNYLSKDEGTIIYYMHIY